MISKKLLTGLSLGVLIVPLAFAACSKKQSPSVSYGSEELGEEMASGGDRGMPGETIDSMRTIYFDYDSSQLTSPSKKALGKNARYLKKNQTMRITIEGHCDERGSSEYNLALGERRANSVRNYISNSGVKRSRMRTVSYGEEKPSSRGHNERAWAKNRRAEFTSR